MARLISSWSKNANSIPQDYVYPVDQRLQLDIPICKEIPVIDLSLAMGTDIDRAKVAQQILKALDDYRAFQVVNHGVPEELMEDAVEVYKEFFNMPVEEKEKYLSDGIADAKKAWLYSGGGNPNERQFMWKDSLGHLSYPLEKTIHFWPEKPARYREVIGKYAVRTKEVSRKIFELICEGLGMEKGYFDGELTEEQVLVANLYPKCPDPSLTAGAVEHYDPNVLTLIQQNVLGLQILKDGKWISVEPLPNAYFVLTSMQLQIITNDRLKSARHRVVTNAENDRLSISAFINSTIETNIEPAKSVLSDGNPPKYKARKHAEYLQFFRAKIAEGFSAVAAGQSAMDSFLL